MTEKNPPGMRRDGLIAPEPGGLLQPAGGQLGFILSVLCIVSAILRSASFSGRAAPVARPPVGQERRDDGLIISLLFLASSAARSAWLKGLDIRARSEPFAVPSVKGMFISERWRNCSVRSLVPCAIALPAAMARTLESTISLIVFMIHLVSGVDNMQY